MKCNLFWLLPLGMSGLVSFAAAPVDYVDPSMGGQGIYAWNQPAPTVSLPNSMVRASYPVRKVQLDDQFHYFPLTIISHRLGELFWLMPNNTADAWDRPEAYDQEVETPYYYSTRFDTSLIRTEFTPTAHCGYFRFTFPSGQPLVQLANRQGGSLTVENDHAISGVGRFFQSMRRLPGHHACLFLRGV